MTLAVSSSSVLANAYRLEVEPVAPSATDKVAALFKKKSVGLHNDVARITDASFQAHFTKSREAILKAAEGLTGTALVVGVGGAHDIPLAELARQFDHIDLVDIDTSLVEEALSEVPEALRGKFQIHQADLTGIWEEFIEGIDKLEKGISEEEFDAGVLAILSSCIRKEFPYDKYSASFVVSSLVSSQLSHGIQEYLEKAYDQRYSKPFLSRYADEITAYVAAIEEAHMEAVYHWVDPAGKVYFADNFSFEMVRYIKFLAPESVIHEVERREGARIPTRIVDKHSDLSAATKVQAAAKRLFFVVREEKWTWGQPLSRAVCDNFQIQFASRGSTWFCSAEEAAYREFPITSWTLTPRFSISAALSPARKVDSFFRSNGATLARNATVTDPFYQTHFSNSRTAILGAAEGLGGTALIVGVGGAHDLPLAELAGQFDHIDLVDIDESSVKKALLGVPEALRGKFQVHKADLSGIWEALVQEIDAWDRTLPKEEFVPRIIAMLTALTRKEFSYGRHSASFVVSSLVSSELSSQVYDYLDRKSRELYGEALAKLLGNKMAEFLAHLTPMEEAHMRDLRLWVDPEGRVYFADKCVTEDRTYTQIGEEIVDTTCGRRVDLAGAKKVLPLAQRLFTAMRDEEWFWGAPLSRRNVLIPVETQMGIAFCMGSQDTYSVRRIASLTLSPRDDHFPIQ